MQAAIAIRLRGVGRDGIIRVMTHRFSIDGDRLAAFRARADEARGSARLAQQRVTEAHNRLSEAQAELTRTERSRPGRPTGVIRVTDGRQHGRFESDHPRLVEQARERLDLARAELDRVSAEQSQGAARREHDLQLFAKLEAHVREARP